MKGNSWVEKREQITWIELTNKYCYLPKKTNIWSPSLIFTTYHTLVWSDMALDLLISTTCSSSITRQKILSVWAYLLPTSTSTAGSVQRAQPGFPCLHSQPWVGTTAHRGDSTPGTSTGHQPLRAEVSEPAWVRCGLPGNHPPQPSSQD